MSALSVINTLSFFHRIDGDYDLCGVWLCQISLEKNNLGDAKQIGKTLTTVLGLLCYHTS